MRATDIGELAQQIPMRTDKIARHLPASEHREEHVNYVVRKCPTIFGIRCREVGIVTKDVGQ
jgi:hypothetical protein